MGRALIDRMSCTFLSSSDALKFDAWSNSHSSIPIAASYCAGTTNFGGAYSSPLALAAAAVSAYSRRMSS